MGSPGIVLSTGLELTEANRPRVPLSQTLFEPVLTTKAALEGPCCPVSCVAMNVSQTHWGRCSFDEGVVTVLQGSDRTLPIHTLPPSPVYPLAALHLLPPELDAHKGQLSKVLAPV